MVREGWNAERRLEAVYRGCIKFAVINLLSRSSQPSSGISLARQLLQMQLNRFQFRELTHRQTRILMAQEVAKTVQPGEPKFNPPTLAVFV